MTNKRSWLDKPVFPAFSGLTVEMALFGLIILIATLARFYDLEARVMSHDESLHTYFSWLLYKGQGYQHSPMMHGPLQFHLLSLSYFLFGVSDFTARIPAVLFNLATIWMVWYWRRYLGRAGSLIAALLMVISPFLLFYGRYVRNEAFSGFVGILMLFAILRYIETSQKRYLYFLTLSLVLHFTAKETSFIYAAQALLFLAIYFGAQVLRRAWPKSEYFAPFVIALIAALVFAMLAFGIGMIQHSQGPLDITQTAAPLNPTDTLNPLAEPGARLSIPLVLGILSGLAILAGAAFLILGYGWERIRSEPSFDLLMLTGTLVLPQLVAFPVSFAGFNPLDYSTTGMIRTAYFLVPIALISIALGIWWGGTTWILNAAVFYGIFTLLYTTVFTNGQGFFTGMIGSLGYWLEQQGVERGSQPWYYYLLIQIPLYEFLPALGSLLALFVVFLKPKKRLIEEDTDIDLETLSENLDEIGQDDIKEINELVKWKPPTQEEENRVNMFSLLLFWIVTSIFAYSYAGEKMPWLTFHIAWPMILLTGWALGQIVERTDWQGLKRNKALLVTALMGVTIIALSRGLLAWLGPVRPFSGTELPYLQATSSFLLAAVVTFAGIGLLVYLLRDWSAGQLASTLILTVFAILSILTGRAAFRAAYIEYDNATEYLVYAHGARGVKDVIEQAEEISQRTTGGMGVSIAYDASAPDTGVSWPMVWYLRDFTNQQSFDVPTRALQDAAIIIVDSKNFGKINAVVRDDYYRFDYTRMWWPNQDYFNLNSERFFNALTDANIRVGIFDIWLDRDYTRYAAATGSDFLTLPTWEPSDRMRMYIRKDIATQIWDYGVGPAVVELGTDVYEGKYTTLPADLSIGGYGKNEGAFDAPRGIAIAPDGSLYVADSRNHRIQHFSADGQFLNAWGTFADINLTGNAPIGTLNEPWGVAVGPDGSVYVTDTWNHRVQKFNADGEPLTMWGFYGLSESGPNAFYGPRGIAVDADGRVYVSDTGNKRIAIFDADGNYLTQFGTVGLGAGEFDEPVDVFVDQDGTVYVTDTWNQRVQTFISTVDKLSYFPLNDWDVIGWDSQSLDNKPFITADTSGRVFITDPEGYRIIAYNPQGEILFTFGEYGTDMVSLGLPSGLVADNEGHLWVTDAGNHRILRFTLPTP